MNVDDDQSASDRCFRSTGMAEAGGAAVIVGIRSTCLCRPVDRVRIAGAGLDVDLVQTGFDRKPPLIRRQSTPRPSPVMF